MQPLEASVAPICTFWEWGMGGEVENGNDLMVVWRVK